MGFKYFSRTTQSLAYEMEFTMVWDRNGVIPWITTLFDGKMSTVMGFGVFCAYGAGIDGTGDGKV